MLNIYYINYCKNGKKVPKIINLRINEEVILKRKKDAISKEKFSEKMKNELLSRKRKKSLNKDYLSAEKCVKNYREKQKSYSGFQKKVNIKTLLLFYRPITDF